MLLLLDRFLGASWPLKYKKIFPKRRTLLAEIIAWIVAFFLMIPRIHLSSENDGLRYGPVVALSIKICVVVSAIFVYTMIAYKIGKYDHTL